MQEQLSEIYHNAAKWKRDHHDADASMDALISACAVLIAGRKLNKRGNPKTTGNEPEPAWIQGAIDRCAGQAVTAGQLLRSGGYFGFTTHQARQVGTWLRARGLTSRLSNGKKLFQLPPKKVSA